MLETTDGPTQADSPQARWHEAAAHRARLVSLGLTRLRNLADAEECAAEAILRAASRTDVAVSDLPRFLTTVMVNLCADVHRRRGREHRALQRLDPYPVESDPFERVLDDAEAAWLLHQVDGLAQHEAQAVHALAAGWQPVAAAERLDMTPKAFESAMGRARRRLKAAWRASLAGVSIAVAATRAAHRRAPLASASLAAAATTAAIFVLFSLPAAPTQPALRLHELPARHSTIPHAAFVPTARMAGSSVPTATTGHASTRQRDAHERTIVRSPGLPGPLRGTAVAVTRSHPDRTFLQSALACLNGGVQIALPDVGCSGD